MIWVGLTGPMACGKSTVAQALLQAFKIPVIDADQLARELLEPESPIFSEVVAFFGIEVMNNGGNIDRKALGKLIFQCPIKKNWLETKTHPIIQKKVAEIKQYLKEQGEELAFYDVPLLFEKSLMSQFDTILLVACNQETQLIRAKQRDGLAESEIFDRLKCQLPLGQKLASSNYVIWNGAEITKESLKRDIANYLIWLRRKFKLLPSRT